MRTTMVQDLYSDCLKLLDHKRINRNIILEITDIILRFNVIEDSQYRLGDLLKPLRKRLIDAGENQEKQEPVLKEIIKELHHYGIYRDEQYRLV